MSSLVATKRITPISNDDDINDGGEQVSSIAFYPNIKLAELRRAMRINGAVTTERLKHAATNAVLYTNDLLNEWQKKQTANALSSMTSSLINGETRYLFLYRHAVYSFTKAYLIENYRDIDTTKDGEKHALALSYQIEDLQRDGQNAVRDIIGKRRMVAELA